MTAIKNVPEEIYLVFEYAEKGDDFADFSEVSWCCDRMSDSDVKFVRADRIATQAAETERLQADGKRLDWMQFNCARVSWGKDGEYCFVEWYGDEDIYRTELHQDWRAAIDAARAAQPKEPA